MNFCVNLANIFSLAIAWKYKSAEKLISIILYLCKKGLTEAICGE